jgi:predicted nucleotide-binding protein
VIFEIGVFAGKLGRDRILVVNAGVDNPSDISGLVFIQYPAGNWQEETVRALRQAGFAADLP